MKSAVLLLSIWLVNGTPTQARTGAYVQDDRKSAVSQEAHPAGAKSVGTKEAAQGKRPKPVEQVAPERIYDVLASVAKESKDWKNATAAASMQAQIADLLWDHDAAAARALLIRAWELTPQVEESDEQPSTFRNNSRRTGIRREVIMVARKRSPELAKKWLEEMTQDKAAQSEKSNTPRGTFDDRSARSTVLLQMAMSGAEENPQAAASLAIESLNDGISFGFQQVLLKLQEKEAALSQKVFSAALTRLRNVGLVDPNELLILHSFLYTPGTIFGANTSDDPTQQQVSMGRSQVSVKSAAEINPALALEFLKLAADLLINAPLPATTDNPQLNARAQISVISILLDKTSQALPEQALALRGRMQQIETDARFIPSPIRTEAQTPLAGENRQDFAQRRIDYLEELARKETDPGRRDIAFGKAALATAIEKYERGISLAGNIRDEGLRVPLIDWLYARASLHFSQTGNLDKSYELLKKSSDPLQKAICLIAGAQKLVNEKDELRAAQWLQEARALVKSVEPDQTLTQISLGIVATYAQFDSTVALDAFTDAVKLINQSPIASLAGEKAPQVKRFSGFGNADYTYGTKGFGLNAAISSFSPAWFESVLESLRKITSAELRGEAIVALCRKNLRPVGNRGNLKAQLP
jgi:hypothetical protein